VWALPATGLVLLAGLSVPGQIAQRDDYSHGWYTYPAAKAFEPLHYSDAANMIANGYRPGDGVYYLRGANWWWMLDVGVTYYLPPNVKPHDVFLSRTAATNNELYAIDCAHPEQCLGDVQRIWMVLPAMEPDLWAWVPPAERAALQQHFSVVSEQHPKGIIVVLLQRTS
jgi:mannosyltransferase